jgi:hypothetical protein
MAWGLGEEDRFRLCSAGHHHIILYSTNLMQHTQWTYLGHVRVDGHICVGRRSLVKREKMFPERQSLLALYRCILKHGATFDMMHSHLNTTS